MEAPWKSRVYACLAGKARSEEPDYKGCGVHVNYKVRGETYYLSDWYNDDSTVATYVNGELRV
jgi:hypothetical protein